MADIEATYKQSNFYQEPGALKRIPLPFPGREQRIASLFPLSPCLSSPGIGGEMERAEREKREGGKEKAMSIFLLGRKEKGNRQFCALPAGNRRRRRRPSIGRRGLLKGWGEGTEWHQIVPTLLVFHSFAKNISQRILSHLCRP